MDVKQRQGEDNIDYYNRVLTEYEQRMGVKKDLKITNTEWLNMERQAKYGECTVSGDGLEAEYDNPKLIKRIKAEYALRKKIREKLKFSQQQWDALGTLTRRKPGETDNELLNRELSPS